SERPDVSKAASAPTEPAAPAPQGGGAVDETDPIGNARWVEPQTPTRQRPRAIDPSEPPHDPESAATSPYMPAMRNKHPSGPAPPMQANISGDAVKDALAHAQTLGPNSPRLPGMPPARLPADQGPPPEHPANWRPAGAPATPNPAPGGSDARAMSPLPGPGGPSMSPLPGPGGPSMSPLPGPGGPSMSPVHGRSMSPMPGPRTPMPGPMGHHASPLPGPYPHHPAPPQPARSRGRRVLFGAAVLVLVAAAVASIVLAASGG